MRLYRRCSAEKLLRCRDVVDKVTFACGLLHDKVRSIKSSQIRGLRENLRTLKTPSLLTPAITDPDLCRLVVLLLLQCRQICSKASDEWKAVEIGQIRCLDYSLAEFTDLIATCRIVLEAIGSHASQ